MIPSSTEHVYREIATSSELRDVAISHEGKEEDDDSDLVRPCSPSTIIFGRVWRFSLPTFHSSWFHSYSPLSAIIILFQKNVAVEMSDINDMESTPILLQF